MGTNVESPGVPSLLAVRATINLAAGGQVIFFDHVACVDPDREAIKEYLTSGYLVALPQTQQSMCDDVAPVVE